MSAMPKWDRLKIVVASAVVVGCVIVGWFVFPWVMAAIGVPSTFTCHCIGGVIGLFGGILVLRKFVFE